ncbi:hypothetical protein FV426_21085 [Salmonella enterica]|nr:hypothetical protein [Salmonella enterica]ECK4752077.1 hypothetical protein [Salmonella enterica]ECO9549504.1 hypothetical protein [Salmonella enterica]EEB2580580.1 hypothetical protein [Salmonella enterica]EEF4729723.1 hypothetical protein [Salmonella enterica]
MLCHGTVCVVGKIRDLILQLSKSSIYSTKPITPIRDVIPGWVMLIRNRKDLNLYFAPKSWKI